MASQLWSGFDSQFVLLSVCFRGKTFLLQQRAQVWVLQRMGRHCRLIRSKTHAAPAQCLARVDTTWNCFVAIAAAPAPAVIFDAAAGVEVAAS